MALEKILLKTIIFSSVALVSTPDSGIVGSEGPEGYENVLNWL